MTAGLASAPPLVKVLLPAALRSYTGDTRLQARGDTLHALFADLDRFRDSVNEALSNLSGKIDIAMTDDLVDSPHLPLGDAVESFRYANPDVYIHIRVASNMSVAQSVINAQSDIGFAGKVKNPARS